MISEKLNSKQVALPHSENLSAEELKWCLGILPQNSLQTKVRIELHSWEIMKNLDDFSLWRVRQNTPTLFFDGASKGNLGEAGVGGIIFDPRGNIVSSYAWGLG